MTEQFSESNHPELLVHWQREHPARFWAFKPGDWTFRALMQGRDYGHWSSNQFVQRLLVELDKPERSMGEICIPIANWIPQEWNFWICHIQEPPVPSFPMPRIRWIFWKVRYWRDATSSWRESIVTPSFAIWSLQALQPCIVFCLCVLLRLAYSSLLLFHSGRAFYKILDVVICCFLV